MVRSRRGRGRRDRRGRAGCTRNREVRLCAGCSDGHELDGAEAVAQVDGEDGDQKQGGHGYADDLDECSDEDSEAAEEFGKNGEPCHEVRAGTPNACRMAVKFSGPLTSLLRPCCMKPKPTMRRKGMGASGLGDWRCGEVRVHGS